MAVSDWIGDQLDTEFSSRLNQARFTVLLDEDFLLMEKSGLPVQRAARRVEGVTETFPNHSAMEVGHARTDPTLPGRIIAHYHVDSYLHVFIAP